MPNYVFIDYLCSCITLTTIRKVYMYMYTLGFRSLSLYRYFSLIGVVCVCYWHVMSCKTNETVLCYNCAIWIGKIFGIVRTRINQPSTASLKQGRVVPRIFRIVRGIVPENSWNSLKQFLEFHKIQGILPEIQNSMIYSRISRNFELECFEICRYLHHSNVATSFTRGRVIVRRVSNQYSSCGILNRA